MDLGPTVLPAIVGIAAYVASKFVDVFVSHIVNETNSREATRTADLQLIETVVYEIRDEACDYWCLSGSAAKQSRRGASIIGRLSFVGALSEGLFEGHPSLRRAADDRLSIFHAACTGDDFGVKSRKADPDRCQLIESSAYGMVHLTAKQRRILPKGFVQRVLILRKL